MNTLNIKVRADDQNGDMQEVKAYFLGLFKERIQRHKSTLEELEGSALLQTEIFDIYHEGHPIKPVGDMKGCFYVSKIINWYAHFGRAKELIELIKKFNINPFIPSTSGLSVVHVLSAQGHGKILNAVLHLKYNYLPERNTEFDLKRVLKIQTTFNLNTPLHLAAIYS